MQRTDRVQLQLVLPYKFEPMRDERIRKYLDRGYRIEQFQRLSDQEALITLRAGSETTAPATPPSGD